MRFTFSFSSPRHLEYYLLQIFIPILLIISVSYVTIFLRDFGRRIEVASANLLLFVAFSWSLADNYPRLGYVTFLDALIAMIFIINSQAEDRQDLADFYSTRFRPEFRPAFDAWLATDPQGNVEAPSSRFAMPEYKVSSLVESDALEEEAAQTFEQGQVANERADAYVLTAVLLASVLFFAGIASGFDWIPVQIGVIVVGTILLAWGLYNLATYPIL